jgi:hypothetical protein
VKTPAGITNPAKAVDGVLDKIVAIEQGEMITEDELAEFLQQLIDTGLAWTLQGTYGRTARDLIEAGLCSAGSAM